MLLLSNAWLARQMPRLARHVSRLLMRVLVLDMMRVFNGASVLAKNAPMWVD